MSQISKKKTKKKISSRILGHRCIILVITARRVVELEALQEVQLVLLYPGNICLHRQKGKRR
jgi:hypothetical protein